MFYLIITLVYCSELEEILTNRSLLIQGFSRVNSQLSIITLYALETVNKNGPLSLRNYYPQMIFIPNPSKGFNDSIYEYDTHKDLIKDPKFRKYMTDEIYSIIFEALTNETSKFLKFGLYSGIQAIVFELIKISSFFDFNECTNSVDVSMKIINYQENIIQIIDNDLRESINKIFDIILIGTIVYAILCILLYLVFYLPYLQKEAFHLKEIQSLVKLVNSVDDNTIKIDNK